MFSIGALFLRLDFSLLLFFSLFLYSLLCVLTVELQVSARLIMNESIPSTPTRCSCCTKEGKKETFYSTSLFLSKPSWNHIWPLTFLSLFLLFPPFFVTCAAVCVRERRKMFKNKFSFCFLFGTKKMTDCLCGMGRRACGKSSEKNRKTIELLSVCLCVCDVT